MNDIGRVLKKSKQKLSELYKSIDNSHNFKELHKNCNSLLDAYKYSNPLKQTSYSEHDTFMEYLNVCQKKINNDQLKQKYDNIATLNDSYSTILKNIETTKNNALKNKKKHNNIKSTFKQMKKDFSMMKKSNNVFILVILVVLLIMALKIIL